jgi:hypothetical protein
MLINRAFYILSFFLIFLLSSLNFSCGEEPLYLNSTQLKLVDTLAKHKIIPMRFEIDSLCDLHFDEEVEKAKDSIVVVRIREINKKLKQ